ncbi:unnamed protein product [Gadus morhua 'NCC']
MLLPTTPAKINTAGQQRTWGFTSIVSVGRGGGSGALLTLPLDARPPQRVSRATPGGPPGTDMRWRSPSSPDDGSQRRRRRRADADRDPLNLESRQRRHRRSEAAFNN